MIPDHSLPFGPLPAACAILSRKPAPRIEDLERVYAERLGVEGAVALPSVRAGIAMVVQACAGAESLLIGPAHTCTVVHQAMRVTGNSVCFLDAAATGFLIALPDLLQAMQPECCLLLCELYGIRYSESFLRATQERQPRLRILDMAMSIPDRARLQAMLPNDVAMFSCGPGKCMYAGWGGIACFRDEAMAREVRALRERCATETPAPVRVRHAIAVLSRACARTRVLRRGFRAMGSAYRAARALLASRRCPAESPAARGGDAALGPQWTRPMTPLNRKLALRNLHGAERDAALRRRQAELYFECLEASGILSGIDLHSLPQSHFAVCVPPEMRQRVRNRLLAHGVETDVIFPFPSHLDRQSFPNSWRLSSASLELPMGRQVALPEVRMISQCLLDSLQAQSRQRQQVPCR